MKKTLAAIAVLGAFAGSAVAADVTLYGKIDTGFAYTRTDTGANGNTDKFEMKAGNNSANRFGFKGTEDLGNGLKVGFVLENGFSSDDGKLSTDGKIFDRESQVNLSGDFGTISVGRVGELTSGNGSFGIFGSAASAIGTGWSSVVGHTAVTAGGYSRFDNTITYKSPKMAGVTVYAQYSMASDSTGSENESDATRWYALGATYAQGPVGAGLIVDYQNAKSWDATDKKASDPSDPIKVSAYASYDLGVAKIMMAGQYFKDSALKTAAIGGYAGGNQDGYGLNLGAQIPVAGGVAKVAVGYMDAETSAEGDDAEIKRYTVSAAYEYSLSKRTSVYAGVSYVGDDYGDSAKEANKIGAGFGLVHNF